MEFSGLRGVVGHGATCPGSSAHGLSSVQALAGPWELVLDALNDNKVTPDKVRMVDSAIVRAHHHAAGAKGGLRRRILAVRKVALRPRHTHGSGLPMRTEITSGQSSDYTGYALVMADNLPAPRIMIADRGYDADSIHRGAGRCPGHPDAPEPQGRASAQRQGIRAANPRGALLQPPQNVRRLATRYGKTAASFLGFINVVRIRLWLRHSST